MVDIDVPSWNSLGVIPPMDEAHPAGAYRSPYKTNIVKFVEKFSTTPKRISILKGFLEFRSELHKVGLVDGFQWINGSFNENIELLEKRPPNDIDVVTFFNIHPGDSQAAIVARNPELFQPNSAEWRKENYHVDSYFQSLQVASGNLVERTVYWYSMWSHRRDLTWKGFLQIPLSPEYDSDAKLILIKISSEGGEQ
ncbi:DUF6932 family protein [Photorhabdus luminescens]|uniref:Uncharacterized protein n=1 Tax=Photorhabdus luminescens subsp. sonorensis TaxID=1173677 RepID=A0A5C4RI75_PHOLU|nr:hypothetical protein [Photorhabdus luminescens]TNH43782.1 hypothetical protein EP164_09555 [Photorhabdus luminescens subsp. sonorensis]